MSDVIAERYRLVGTLGEGGMGRVWQARDELLGRDVALKELVLPRGQSQAQVAILRERAIREARAAARIDHPNVVRVFDVVHAQDGPWIVMELVTSRSLYDVVRHEGPLRPERAAAIGLAVLAGLRAAHRAGVLHRDVKPANVLLGIDGRVVLTDFGLATATGDSAMTGTGVVLGSPSYLAPERALDHEVTPAADLWSLGATLYAAVEGRPPYDKSSPMATLTALATQPPRPPQQAGVLAPALEGLLRKNPAERVDADEAERLLREAADGRPAPAPQRLGHSAPPDRPGAGNGTALQGPGSPQPPERPGAGNGTALKGPGSPEPPERPGAGDGTAAAEAGVPGDTLSTVAAGGARASGRARWWAGAAAVLLIAAGFAARPLLTAAHDEAVRNPGPQQPQPPAALSPGGPPPSAVSQNAPAAGVKPGAGSPVAHNTKPRPTTAGTAKTTGTPTASPPPATTAAAPPPAVGSPISNFATGDCLKLDTGSGRIVMWTCDGSDAQKFDLPADGTMRVLGKCVQLLGTDDGARLGTAGCDGSKAQQWNYNTSYDLVSLQVIKCTDVPDTRTADGTPAQVWECAGTSNQKWHH